MFREFAIAREQVLDEHDRRVTLAWCVAVLNNQKKIPKLDTLLSRRKQQTPEEQRAVMQSIADRLGLKIRKKKKGA